MADEGFAMARNGRGRKFATWAAAQSEAEGRVDCKNLHMQSSVVKVIFGRTKPNCAVPSMAAEAAGQLSAGIRISAEGVVGIMPIVTAVAAAMLLDPHASQAYEMPWCALTEIAGGAMYENCALPTFELCVQEVIAGNRGFCIPNPRWQAPRPKARQPGGQRKRVDY
jgi:hypothetical protein